MVLSNLPADGQIHASNLKSPVERDLLYIHNIMIAKTEDDVFIVRGAWVVSTVRLKSDTGETRT